MMAKNVRKLPKWRHECPGCSKVIKWNLRFCALCSWRGFPLKNEQWRKA